MQSLAKTVPVSWQDVKLQTGLWADRQKINREITLPIEYEQCLRTGRIAAFKQNWKKGKPKKPHQFFDSDVAKWIEAAAYSLAHYPDPGLMRKVDQVISWIIKAQQPDGYLNTYYTVIEPENRWSNLRDMHELYCAGHLMEAAVAYFQATGKREFMDVMCRYADYIDAVFGTGKGKKRGYPGHQEIELALVKLYRATDEKRYLKLAEYFINERGRQPHYFDEEARSRGDNRVYNDNNYDSLQAHLPVREQTTAEGHSVRACYLYAGMADIAAETGDRELLKACRRIWKNIINKRMYIHGGIGSTHKGERFTFDYDLSNEEAYAETCAAIALVFFAQRMLQIDPDGNYADIIERALYNGILSGISLDGTRFYYDNYLASYPGYHEYYGRKSPERQEWFGTSCCPPNIARLFASLGGYIYTQNKNSLYINLYAENTADIVLNDTACRIEQKTAYPWNGTIRIAVKPEKPVSFSLALRIPAWCVKPEIKINGKRLAYTGRIKKGYIHIKQVWHKGDRIIMNLSMPVERIYAHPSVRHDAGRFALQRGPILYCLEEKDNGKDLNSLRIPEQAALKVTKGSGIFKNIPLITIRGKRIEKTDWQQKLYRTEKPVYKNTDITAIPYALWANRGKGEMITWIRE